MGGFFCLEEGVEGERIVLLVYYAEKEGWGCMCINGGVL